MIPIEFIPDDEKDVFNANWPQIPRVGERVTHGDDKYVVTDVTWGFHVTEDRPSKILYDDPCAMVKLILETQWEDS